jgi:hypothetical protein
MEWLKVQALSLNPSTAKKKKKKNFKEGFGGVAQIIEHLPSKWKVLSLSSSTEKLKYICVDTHTHTHTKEERYSIVYERSYLSVTIKHRLRIKTGTRLRNWW